MLPRGKKRVRKESACVRGCYVLPMACTKCVWGGDRRIDIFIVRGGGGPQENGGKEEKGSVSRFPQALKKY